MKQNGKVFLAFAFAVCMALPVFGEVNKDELSLFEKKAQEAATAISSQINSGSIAVVRIYSEDADLSQLSQQIISWLENKLVEIGNLTTVSRVKINDALQEQDIALTGKIDDKSAQKIGHLLGAEYVLTGYINSFPGKYILNIQVLQTETGKLVYSDSFSIEGGGTNPTSIVI